MDYRYALSKDLFKSMISQLLSSSILLTPFYRIIGVNRCGGERAVLPRESPYLIHSCAPEQILRLHTSLPKLGSRVPSP